MKQPSDPIRLLDDPETPARLADALRQARSTPDAAAMTKMSGVLGVPVPPAPPVVPPISGLAAASGSSAIGFLGWGGAVTVGLGTAAVVLSGSASKPAPVAVEARPSPVVVAPVVPPARAEPLEVAVEAPASTAPRVVRKKRGDPEPAPAAEPVPPAVVAEKPAAAVDAASRLREEALLVRHAERLLASDPAKALRLTEERRERFPGGALGQEAEVVAIDALLRLGRRDAAVRRARAFEASHKDSLYGQRIRALVGNP
jgi:hypothetical protein